ncbi:MAG TPA: hypothetical protein VHM92_05260 [Allosphingosinicella sp.]|nr:hypothetical protein [Allosphingosinicella sp.]
MILSPGQGRAPHLYDEQLQRVQQEKMLAAAPAGERPFLLGGGAPSRKSEAEAKTDAA